MGSGTRQGHEQMPAADNSHQRSQPRSTGNQEHDRQHHSRQGNNADCRVVSLLDELEQARKREQAAEINQPSAAVSATVAKAKLAGLIVDRREVGKPGEFEGMNVDEQ